MESELTIKKANWVDFDTINALRFPYKPLPDNQWRRWCRAGKVPCCRFPDGWRIDLTHFDEQFRVSKQADIDEALVDTIARTLRLP